MEKELKRKMTGVRKIKRVVQRHTEIAHSLVFDERPYKGYEIYESDIKTIE